MNGSWGPSRIPVKRYRFSKKEGVQLTLQYKENCWIELFSSYISSINKILHSQSLNNSFPQTTNLNICYHLMLKKVFKKNYLS
jgi:hypothetical protein